jgi:hypothetical protein
MKASNKGQVGPFSLEVLFPMFIAVMLSFAFIALIFSSVTKNLKERNAETTHRTAADLLQVLSGRSILTYANTPQLLDYASIQNTTCEDLYEYCPTAYNCSIQIYDLREDITELDCGTPNENAVALAAPVAILYSADNVGAGEIKVWVWRQR